MRLTSLSVLGLFVLVSLSGCMDVFGGDDHEPRTVRITLEVKPGTSDTIPLYTLNDGESQMEGHGPLPASRSCASPTRRSGSRRATR